jgi:hypothetical protein
MVIVGANAPFSIMSTLCESRSRYFHSRLGVDNLFEGIRHSIHASDIVCVPLFSGLRPGFFQRHFEVYAHLSVCYISTWRHSNGLVDQGKTVQVGRRDEPQWDFAAVKNEERSKLRSRTACGGYRVAEKGSAIVPSEMPLVEGGSHQASRCGFIDSHTLYP